MNARSNPPAPRRRLWPWVLLGLFCLPFLVLGAAAVSYLKLDRPAAVLRREVMQATGADWDRRVQVSVGGVTIGAVRGGLSIVQNEKVDEARRALAALRGASVGVYALQGRPRDWSSPALLERTDRAMEDRGWFRVAGVVKARETVLVYTPADAGDPERVCVAVLGDRQLVVVSVELKPEQLLALIQRHAAGRLCFREQLRLAAD